VFLDERDYRSPVALGFVDHGLGANTVFDICEPVLRTILPAKVPAAAAPRQPAHSCRSASIGSMRAAPRAGT
jgi:hypothetical protein